MTELVDGDRKQDQASPTGSPEQPADVRLDGVTVNAPDALALARFYADLLGGQARGTARWAVVASVGGLLAFQQDIHFVAPAWPARPDAGPATVHLDFQVATLDAPVAHALACGARKPAHQPNADHCVVLTDPVGHPFCLSTWNLRDLHQHAMAHLGQPAAPVGTDRQVDRSHRAGEDDILEHVRSVYDQVASLYDELLPDTRNEPEAALALIDAFIDAAHAAAAPDQPRVLDAGSGTGRMYACLKDRGCHVNGIDISPAMTATARRHHPDISTTVASLDKTPFADDTFDGVVMWYSTIHTPDQAMPDVIGEARRVLKPGGALVLAFQIGSGQRSTGQTYRNHGIDVTLTRYHRSPDQIAALLDSAGLQERTRLVRQPDPPAVDPQAVIVAVRPNQT